MTPDANFLNNSFNPFLETENDIPSERINKFLKIILICRIGKGIQYNTGVSPSGRPLYDKFLSLLGDENIILAIIAMHSNDVRVHLDNKYCQDHMEAVLNIFKENARSPRIQEILDYLITNKKILNKIHLDKGYKDVTKNHITWG